MVWYASPAPVPSPLPYLMVLDALVMMHVCDVCVRVRHSVAVYGQLLLFCDQSMREKAWRSRKRRTLLAGAACELAGATRLRQAKPSSACIFSGVRLCANPALVLVTGFIDCE